MGHPNDFWSFFVGNPLGCQSWCYHHHHHHLRIHSWFHPPKMMALREFWLGVMKPLQFLPETLSTKHQLGLMIHWCGQCCQFWVHLQIDDYEDLLGAHLVLDQNSEDFHLPVVAF
mmetsp:Transcript_97883/g.224491  ORF Transcript_97883/g.224491 Transcript_97883/m.224491 type:complete len:115 (-) Transcript_97883:37-381(-)